MEQLKIAVIGSGISGLSAAWLLAQRHRVTLYEASPKPGGHSNTVDVDDPGGPIPVDTGFIVYNEQNYPNLTALFAHLGVDTAPTEMSFALSIDDGSYEYSGSGAGGFFGQPRNLLRPRHWRMAADIRRFFKTAGERIRFGPADLSLGAFLSRESYSRPFIDDHIVPMGAAIWSSDADRLLDFPARSFIEFYANHGLMQLRDRPPWRTVRGGSRQYVERMVTDAGLETQLGSRALRIFRRPNYVAIADQVGAVRPFDQVVIATHADQALALLEQPDELESRTLGSFSYQTNRAILHRDRRWMPRRRRLWSSWNYLKWSGGDRQGLCVTYWMNRLQPLNTTTDLFVTLNPPDVLHPKAIDGVFEYRHPVFTARAVAAQSDLPLLQGTQRTWYCGSYCGYGFHEDGIQSGLAVAEALGGVRRPWTVANQSGRVAFKGADMLVAAE